MKPIMIIALLLSVIVAATAQTPILPMPQAKTLPIKDAAGKNIGTATIWHNRIVVRDTNGELMGTIVIDENGKETRYDPSGKLLAAPQ